MGARGCLKFDSSEMRVPLAMLFSDSSNFVTCSPTGPIFKIARSASDLFFRVHLRTYNFHNFGV